MTDMVVHKYPLPLEVETIIEAPIFAQALSLQVQDGRPCLWMLVNRDLPTCKLRITMVGTGIDIPGETDIFKPPAVYIGTVQLNDGRLVLHAWMQPILPPQGAPL